MGGECFLQRGLGFERRLDGGFLRNSRLEGKVLRALGNENRIRCEAKLGEC